MQARLKAQAMVCAEHIVLPPGPVEVKPEWCSPQSGEKLGERFEIGITMGSRGSNHEKHVFTMTRVSLTMIVV